MFDTNPHLIQEAPRAAPWMKPAPLVLIHDGGGTTFSYHCLGNLDRTVYGISNPHYKSGETKWEDGLHGMARHYLKLIKTVIPRGKLILGGWSLGGLVSLEIARLLADDPAMNLVGIVMVDSIYPLVRRTQDATVPIVQHAMEWSDRTRQETRDTVLRCFSEAQGMVSTWTPPTWGDDETQSQLQSLTTATNTLSPSKTQGPPPPPVILLRAEQAVPIQQEKGVSRVDISRDDRLLGWGEYRQGLITEVVDLPNCHHFNLFISDEALDIATEKIRKACLDLEALASGAGAGAGRK